jgi:hypothetical protein
MAEIDEFASTLLDEAKRFLEKASQEDSFEGASAYLHAALQLGFASLEAHVNAIGEDFLSRTDLSLLDESILKERDFRLDNGQFVLVSQLKMYRLEDRVQFLFRRFSATGFDASVGWWGELKAGLKLRNSLTHPKQSESISQADVERCLKAILDALDALYQAIYRQPYPAIRRQLRSRMTF